MMSFQNEAQSGRIDTIQGTPSHERLQQTNFSEIYTDVDRLTILVISSHLSRDVDPITIISM